MRQIKLIALTIAVCLAITGCAANGEVENQAFALVLGVDRVDGAIELTMRIPHIGKSGESGDTNGGSEDYLVLSARGDSYAQALEHLQWSVERELNLSQLKLVIVSESLASEPGFAPLISSIAETRHLYTTSAFVVCEGSAREFIEGQETVLGTRLSSEIAAEFRHYAAHGYIPRSTFADLYYLSRSFYSDPTGIRGFIESDKSVESGDSTPASAVIAADPDDVIRETDTASSRHCLGAVIFRDGVLARLLDARETLLLDLATGRVDSFVYSAGGNAYSLSSILRPKRRVRVSNGAVEIALTVRLASEARLPKEAVEPLKSSIANDIVTLIHSCQADRLDPFGFAERAAIHFPTFDDWLAFDWRERFAEASVSVEVTLLNAARR